MVPVTLWNLKNSIISKNCIIVIITCLYSNVAEILILYEVRNTNKSIRVAELTFEPLSFALCCFKIVRLTFLFLETLKATRFFRVHFYFFNHASIQLSPFYHLSKVNGFQIRL